MPFTRISIPLPRDVLAAADRRARALDRSRSWLIVEAIRAYLSQSPSPVQKLVPGLGPLRLAQLQSDLQLTPERRGRAGGEGDRKSKRLNSSPIPLSRIPS